MKRKLFWLQLAAIGLILVSLAAMGILIFSRHGLDNLMPLYVFAGLGMIGLVANACIAVARAWWEWRERNGRK